VSSGTKDALEAKYSMKIHGVVTPGVPSRIFEADVQRIEGYDGKIILLFVGRLQESKGIFELIEIFKELCRIRDNLLLVIAGKGQLREEIMRRITRYGITDKVLLTGGIEHDDVLRWYSTAHVLIHPTTSEVFSITTLEAMAFGLPIVTTDIPQMLEVTGGTAVHLNIGNPELWIKKIEELLNDDEQCKSIGLKEMERAKKFTWEQKAKEYERFLILATEKR
jgi:glycosyltransferase involved in cell wall biosynthesis